MRFRTTTDWTQLLVLLYVALQTLLNIGRIPQHLDQHRRILASFEIAAQIALVLIGIQALITLFRSHIKLTPNALRLRSGIWSKEMPYAWIVGVRPSDAGARRNLKAVELEIARLDPAVYPHQYIVLKVADRDTFTRELRSKIPQAAYEF